MWPDMMSMPHFFSFSSISFPLVLSHPIPPSFVIISQVFIMFMRWSSQYTSFAFKQFIFITGDHIVQILFWESGILFQDVKLAYWCFKFYLAGLGNCIFEGWFCQRGSESYAT